ncbi:MAG: prepilin-type N-terminal cleavage/methylation domain-containing protein [Sedimentisphaerales bacterium]|nr:prepilin-type N-terminal cleavage/methylation domain-containing protein [Sedimentisphaerales bacterium]
MSDRHPPWREASTATRGQAGWLPLVKSQPHRGFTLIELLVVVTVIAILLAILVSSLRKARETARRVVCIGHLRQLQIAWLTYAENHDGAIVSGMPFYHIYEKLPDEPSWLSCVHYGDHSSKARVNALMRTGALARYVGDVSVYRCPSQYELPQMPGWEPWLRWFSAYAIVSSMNCLTPEQRAAAEAQFVEFRGPSPVRAYIKKLSELSPPGPAQRMVFVDVGCPYWTMQGPADFYMMAGPSTRQRGWTTFGHGPPLQHGNGTCTSFADGSVRYWKWKDPRTIAWSQAWLQLYQAGQTGPRPEPPPDPDNRDYSEFYKAIWGRF